MGEMHCDCNHYTVTILIPINLMQMYSSQASRSYLFLIRVEKIREPGDEARIRMC